MGSRREGVCLNSFSSVSCCTWLLALVSLLLPLMCLPFPPLPLCRLCHWLCAGCQSPHRTPLPRGQRTHLPRGVNWGHKHTHTHIHTHNTHTHLILLWARVHTHNTWFHGYSEATCTACYLQTVLLSLTVTAFSSPTVVWSRWTSPPLSPLPTPSPTQWGGSRMSWQWPILTRGQSTTCTRTGTESPVPSTSLGCRHSSGWSDSMSIAFRQPHHSPALPVASRSTDICISTYVRTYVHMYIFLQFLSPFPPIMHTITATSSCLPYLISCHHQNL